MRKSWYNDDGGFLPSFPPQKFAMIEVKKCEDYSDAPSCCVSCHEDMAMGEIDVPLEVEDENNNVIARVCCIIYNWIHAEALKNNGHRNSQRE